MSDSSWHHGPEHARTSCFHWLLELGQIHVVRFDDTVQCHPLSSPSPLAFTLSQHQGLFEGVFSSHEMSKVLEPQLPVSIPTICKQLSTPRLPNHLFRRSIKLIDAFPGLPSQAMGPSQKYKGTHFKYAKSICVCVMFKKWIIIAIPP